MNTYKVTQPDPEFNVFLVEDEKDTFVAECDNVNSANLITAALNAHPVVTLTCGCCGGEAKGRQWYNQDVGFGLCSDCAERFTSKEGEENVRNYYGINRIHYFMEKSK